jgi:hypothetical protein
MFCAYIVENLMLMSESLIFITATSTANSILWNSVSCRKSVDLGCPSALLITDSHLLSFHVSADRQAVLCWEEVWTNTLKGWCAGWWLICLIEINLTHGQAVVSIAKNYHLPNVVLCALSLNILTVLLADELIFKTFPAFEHFILMGQIIHIPCVQV